METLFYILTAFVLLGIPVFLLQGLGKLKQKVDFDGHMEREALARKPRLDQRFFIQMPEGDVRHYYGGWIDELRGTFSSRYIHVVVVDFDGTVWVGVWRDEVSRTLAKGGFEQGTYFVPLCGPEEGLDNHGANFIERDGSKCEIFPYWLRDKSQDDLEVQEYLQLLAERQSTANSYQLYKLMKEKAVTRGVS